MWPAITCFRNHNRFDFDLQARRDRTLPVNVGLSQLLSSLLSYSLALSFNCLDPSVWRDSKAGQVWPLPLQEGQVGSDLRPQSQGQKQMAPRKDIIQRPSVFYWAHTVVFNLINYFSTFKKLIQITITPNFQNSVRKRKAALTLNFVSKQTHTTVFNLLCSGYFFLTCSRMAHTAGLSPSSCLRGIPSCEKNVINLNTYLQVFGCF